MTNTSQHATWIGLIGVAVLIMILFFFQDARAENEGMTVTTDPNIEWAIEGRFDQDDRVQEHLIDVVVERGIVTLIGNVDSLLSKQRASDLAETIKGVRSVINRMVVTSSSRIDDETINNHVQSALLDNPATELYDIDVTVENGSVHLQGTVQSWQEKQLTLQVAKGVKGIIEIKDDVTIKTTKHRADHAMREEIIQRLTYDVWVNSDSIDVVVQDGTVTLSGTDPSSDQKSRALHLSWVHGITAVHGNQLNVEWSSNTPLRRSGLIIPSDETIHQAIHDALSYDPRVAKSDMVVEVSEGLVTLTGTVETLYAKQAVEEDARNTVGIHRVVNHLKVRSHVDFSDKDIASRVNATFSRDPFLHQENIQVDVHNGTIFLRGHVNSRYQQARATTLAYGVRGAVNVINTLQHPVERVEKSDFELRQDIQEQFWWSPFLSVESLNVHVEDGVATLGGTVDSWRQRHIAEENAFATGARSVHNQLRMKSLNHSSFMPSPEEFYR